MSSSSDQSSNTMASHSFDAPLATSRRLRPLWSFLLAPADILFWYKSSPRPQPNKVNWSGQHVLVPCVRSRSACRSGICMPSTAVRYYHHVARRSCMLLWVSTLYRILRIVVAALPGTQAGRSTRCDEVACLRVCGSEGLRL